MNSPVYSELASEQFRWNGWDMPCDIGSSDEGRVLISMYQVYDYQSLVPTHRMKCKIIIKTKMSERENKV